MTQRFVIASAAKQSRAVYAALDCFVAALLAMTELLEVSRKGAKDAKRTDLLRASLSSLRLCVSQSELADWRSVERNAHRVPPWIASSLRSSQ